MCSWLTWLLIDFLFYSMWPTATWVPTDSPLCRTDSPLCRSASVKNCTLEPNAKKTAHRQSIQPAYAQSKYVGTHAACLCWEERLQAPRHENARLYHCIQRLTILVSQTITYSRGNIGNTNGTTWAPRQKRNPLSLYLELTTCLVNTDCF